MNTERIGILGIDRLGESLARAVLRNPNLTTLYVTRRNAQRAQQLVDQDPRVCIAEVKDVLARCDIIIISLSMQVAETLLPTLGFTSRHHVLSAMAEISASNLNTLTGGTTGSLCRVLALPSVERGGQVLPVFPKTEAVMATFGDRNTILDTMNEEKLLTYWAITGALSATMLVGDVATRWLQSRGIASTDADVYARSLYSEVYHLLENGFPRGMAHVSTPGGLNEQLFRQLNEAGVGKAIGQGLEAIQSRISKNVE